MGEEGRGALTSSRRAEEGAVPWVEGGHPRDAPSAPPPTPPHSRPFPGSRESGAVLVVWTVDLYASCLLLELLP